MSCSIRSCTRRPSRIDASLRVLPTEPKPIGQWFPVKVHHAAAEVPGRVVVLRDEAIGAGETEFIQLVLERPLAAAAGDRFVLRDTSSSRTVGGGTLHRSARAGASASHARAPCRTRRAVGQGPGRRHRPGAGGRPTGSTLDGFARDRGLGDDAMTQSSTSLSLVDICPARGPRGYASTRRGSGSPRTSARRSMHSMPSGRTCPASGWSSCARARSRRCRYRCSWRCCDA